jgi:drug/metabolite transporter (DMT)-like permease
VSGEVGGLRKTLRSILTLAPHHISGSAWLIMSLLAAFGINPLIKSLSVHHPAFQILAIKCGAAGFVLLSVRGLQDLTKALKSQQKIWLIAKGILGFLGNGFLIIALQKMALANVAALSLVSAILTALGGIVFYHERFLWNRWLSLGIGSFGVLLIVQPSWSTLGIFAMFPVLSAICFSASSLLVKRLVQQDSPLTLVTALLSVMTLLAGSVGIAQWNWIQPSRIDGLIMVMIGALYLVCQIALVQAYRYAEASALAPLKALRYPFHGVLGWILWNETPSVAALCGGGFILGSCFLLQKYKCKTHFQ